MIYVTGVYTDIDIQSQAINMYSINWRARVFIFYEDFAASRTAFFQIVLNYRNKFTIPAYKNMLQKIVDSSIEVNLRNSPYICNYSA